MRSLLAIVCAMIVAAAVACGDSVPEEFKPGPTVDPAVTPAALTVSTDSFDVSKELPERFTCFGPERGVSPSVSWSEGPEGTRSYVVFMREFGSPVGDIFHWAIANLPPSVRSIDEGAGARLGVEGGTHVKNNLGSVGYGAPCPAVVARERDLQIEVFALNTRLALAVREPDAGHVVIEMAGHVLARGSLSLVYDR